MKISKSYKILTLLLTLFLSVICAFALMQGNTVNSVRAEDTPSTAFSSGKVENLKYEDNYLVKTVVSDDTTLSFKNKICLNDLEIKSAEISGLSKITITVKTDSFFKSYGAGVINEDDELTTSIENVVVLDIANEKLILNGLQSACTDFTTVLFNVDNNVLSVTVGGVNIENTDSYFTVYGKEKVSANVSYEFELEAGVTNAEYKIEYIDQGASVAGNPYKQTFELNNGAITKALPRVFVSETVMFDEEGNLLLIDGRTYDLGVANSTSFLSVFSPDNQERETYKIGNIVPNNDGKGSYWLENNATPDKVAFYLTDGAESDEFVIQVKGTKHGDTVIEQYNVKVVKDSSDTTAPKYKDLDQIENALKAIAKKLDENLHKEYTVNGETVVRHIRLGSSLSVPNMEALVVDDLSASNSTDLKHTIYYKTPTNSSSSTSSTKFSLSNAGDYQYYVLYKDEMGNVLDKNIIETALTNGISSEFIEAEGAKVKLVNYIDNVNLVYIDIDKDDVIDEIVPVFYFTILDDAPIFVNAVTEQTSGYIGVEYNVTPFEIVDADFSSTTILGPVYTLYYNSSVNAEIGDEGWVVIPASEKIAEGYSVGGLSYDDLKGINYDGKLKFTPVKGAYYISCKVTSVKSDRFEEANTNVIKIAEKPTEVKVDRHWLKNNVWSVVFLSVGTLCLAGIIVLLCVKPKEKTEEE